MYATFYVKILTLVDKYVRRQLYEVTEMLILCFYFYS